MSVDLFVFGYGSLVWKVGFPYEEKLECWLVGFRRRFWQGSTDHRGVEGSPGRVVTILPAGEVTDGHADEPAAVWGVAYRISPDRQEEVLSYLDFREKGGYCRRHMPLHADPAGRGEPVVARALVYYASRTNDNFLGPAPLEEIALTIKKSVGPSGPNIEYFLNLVVALRERGVSDKHIEELHEVIGNLPHDYTPLK